MASRRSNCARGWNEKTHNCKHPARLRLSREPETGMLVIRLEMDLPCLNARHKKESCAISRYVTDGTQGGDELQVEPCVFTFNGHVAEVPTCLHARVEQLSGEPNILFLMTSPNQIS